MPDKINILMLVDKFDYHGSGVSGPVRNYCWLLQRIDGDRFQVHLYALRKRGRSAEIFSREGVGVGYLGLGRFNPFTWLIICRLVYRHGIDLLHLQGYGSVLFGQIAALITRRPAIVKEEWVDPKISAIQCLAESALSWHATRIIAISKYTSLFLQNKKRIAPQKIVHIPNGIPLNQFRPDRHAAAAQRAKWRLAPHHLVVGIVGMLHENKGHRYFLEAAAKVVGKLPDSRYLIVGDGEERDHLEAITNDLKLNDHVIFMGQQLDMKDVYPMMDIFVVASSTESLSMSLIEAMACGCPVISTACGGPEEIVSHNVDGILVPVRNAEALADAIRDLMENPEKRGRLGRAAALRSQSFDISRTVAQTQEVYARVCQGTLSTIRGRQNALR